MIVTVDATVDRMIVLWVKSCFAMEADRSLVPVLIIGGWSPGPLMYLKRGLRRQCIFLEPSVPMPPVGCSWCIDKHMLALLCVLAFMSWSCHDMGGRIDRKWLLFLTRVGIVAVSLVVIRFLVAGIVRSSVQKGVQIAHQCLQRHRNVAVIIGFSWGGGVVAEMLRQGLVGNEGQPPALLIAPTTALMASPALQRDPALEIRVQDPTRVHVFHGTEDGAFCPHAERWEQTNATVHWCHDNHVFMQRNSLQELARTLLELLSRSQVGTSP